MDKKYNASDIEQELRAVSFYLKDSVEIPDAGYEKIFTRLCETRENDRKDESLLAILIFHALCFLDGETPVIDISTKNEIYAYATVAARRLLETDIMDNTEFPPVPVEVGING